MSTRLDDLIASAEGLDGAWDADRAVRVRAGALRRRDGRVRRDRVLRRGLLVAAGASLLVLGLLRAASSAPSLTASAPSSSATADLHTDSPEALAARTLGDAGYARD